MSKRLSKISPQTSCFTAFFEFIGQIAVHHSGVHWAVSMLPMLENPRGWDLTCTVRWQYGSKIAWRLRFNMIGCCPRWDKHRRFIVFFSILNNSIWRCELGVWRAAAVNSSYVPRPKKQRQLYCQMWQPPLMAFMMCLETQRVVDLVANCRLGLDGGIWIS